MGQGQCVEAKRVVAEGMVRAKAEESMEFGDTEVLVVDGLEIAELSDAVVIPVFGKIWEPETLRVLNEGTKIADEMQKILMEVIKNDTALDHLQQSGVYVFDCKELKETGIKNAIIVKVDDSPDSKSLKKLLTTAFRAALANNVKTMAMPKLYKIDNLTDLDEHIAAYVTVDFIMKQCLAEVKHFKRIYLVSNDEYHFKQMTSNLLYAGNWR